MAKSEHQKIVEEHIYEYISKIDFNHPDFDIKEFKLHLNSILGIEPGVKFKWDKKEVVNELLKNSGAKEYKKIIEKVSEIDILYVGPDNDSLPISLKFII